MKKSKVLLTSGILTLIALISGLLEPFYLCGGQWRICMEYNYTIGTTLIPVVFLFLFSLITYRMSEKIFSAWSKFAVVWIPLSMLAIFLAPEYSGDFLFPIEKGTVAIISSLIFLVISTFFILRYNFKHE